LGMQSLPQLGSDKEAQKSGQANWESFKGESGGEKAVAGARHSYALRSAIGSFRDNAATSDANRALGIGASVPAASAAPATDSNVRLAQYSEQGQSRFVAGRNAFQNGDQ